MINKVTAIEVVLERLKTLPVGQSLDLRTYKRNRSVRIHKISQNTYHVTQDGYEYREIDTTADKIKKLLKTLLKKEFPRSTMVRLYTLSEDEAVGKALQRKKL